MKVELTKQQIEAILMAMGQTTQYNDAMVSTFTNLREVNTCIRAENKLRNAIGNRTISEWDSDDLKEAYTL